MIELNDTSQWHNLSIYFRGVFNLLYYQHFLCSCPISVLDILIYNEAHKEETADKKCHFKDRTILF